MQQSNWNRDSPYKAKVPWWGIILILAAIITLVWWARRVPESDINWGMDLAAARAQAKATGKGVLVLFTGWWCPPCQAMERTVWPDAGVEKLINDKFIPLKFEVDQQGDGLWTFEYGVEEVPTVMVLDADGNVVGTRMIGLHNAGETISFLKLRLADLAQGKTSPPVSPDDNMGDQWGGEE